MRISPNDAVFIIVSFIIVTVVFHGIYTTIRDEVEYQRMMRRKTQQRRRL